MTLLSISGIFVTVVADSKSPVVSRRKGAVDLEAELDLLLVKPRGGVSGGTTGGDGRGTIGGDGSQEAEEYQALEEYQEESAKEQQKKKAVEEFQVLEEYQG